MNIKALIVVLSLFVITCVCDQEIEHCIEIYKPGHGYVYLCKTESSEIFERESLSKLNANYDKDVESVDFFEDVDLEEFEILLSDANLIPKYPIRDQFTVEHFKTMATIYAQEIEKLDIEIATLNITTPPLENKEVIHIVLSILVDKLQEFPSQVKSIGHMLQVDVYMVAMCEAAVDERRFTIDYLTHLIGHTGMMLTNTYIELEKTDQYKNKGVKLRYPDGYEEKAM